MWIERGKADRRLCKKNKLYYRIKNIMFATVSTVYMHTRMVRHKTALAVCRVQIALCRQYSSLACSARFTLYVTSAHTLKLNKKRTT